MAIIRCFSQLRFRYINFVNPFHAIYIAKPQLGKKPDDGHYKAETCCFTSNLKNTHLLYKIQVVFLTTLPPIYPLHVSSIIMLIFRRFNCICTASGTVTHYERPYVTLVKTVAYGRSQRVTVPDAVHIQLNLLKMSIIMLETCSGM